MNSYLKKLLSDDSLSSEEIGKSIHQYSLESHKSLEEISIPSGIDIEELNELLQLLGRKLTKEYNEVLNVIKDMAVTEIESRKLLGKSFTTNELFAMLIESKVGTAKYISRNLTLVTKDAVSNDLQFVQANTRPVIHVNTDINSATEFTIGGEKSSLRLVAEMNDLASRILDADTLEVCMVDEYVYFKKEILEKGNYQKDTVGCPVAVAFCNLLSVFATTIYDYTVTEFLNFGRVRSLATLSTKSYIADGCKEILSLDIDDGHESLLGTARFVIFPDVVTKKLTASRLICEMYSSAHITLSTHATGAVTAMSEVLLMELHNVQHLLTLKAESPESEGEYVPEYKVFQQTLVTLSAMKGFYNVLEPGKRTSIWLFFSSTYNAIMEKLISLLEHVKSKTSLCIKLETCVALDTLPKNAGAVDSIDISNIEADVETLKEVYDTFDGEMQYVDFP